MFDISLNFCCAPIYWQYSNINISTLQCMESQSNVFLNIHACIPNSVSQCNINKFCTNFTSCQLRSVVLAVQEESLSALNYACDCTWLALPCAREAALSSWPALWCSLHSPETVRVEQHITAVQHCITLQSVCLCLCVCRHCHKIPKTKVFPV